MGGNGGRVVVGMAATEGQIGDRGGRRWGRGPRGQVADGMIAIKRHTGDREGR